MNWCELSLLTCSQVLTSNFMSLTTRVLIGLLAGFGLGLALAGSTSPAVAALLAVVAPVGTIFINLIRMTVIPLVASMLIASVGSLASSGALGRAGVRAAVGAVVMLALTAIVTVLIARRRSRGSTSIRARPWRCAGRPQRRRPRPAHHPLLRPRSMDRRPRPAERLEVSLRRGDVPPDSLRGAVRPGAVRAWRRRGAMRCFGSLQGVRRCDATAGRGHPAFAPVGVFALAGPLASKLGLSAAAAVVAYIVLVVSLTLLVGARAAVSDRHLSGRHVAARVHGLLRAGPGRRIRVPLVAGVAAGDGRERARTRSCRRSCRGSSCRWRHRSFASVRPSRCRSACCSSRGLYGLTLSPAQLASIVFTVILSSFAVPGVPGGSIIAMVPVWPRSTCRSTASASCWPSTRSPTCSVRPPTSPAA